MSDPNDMRDPPRLLDGAEGDLGALLRAGESDLPGDARLAAIATKLGPIVGGGLGGAGGAGGTGGGGAAVKTAATAGKASTLLKVGGLGLGWKAIGVAVVAGAIATGSIAGVSRRNASTEGVVESAPARTQATQVAVVESAPAPSAIAPIASLETSSSATNGAPRARAAATSDDGPEEEVKLLERAQDALRSNPAQALALCNEHQRRFAHPSLTQEREVIAIEALSHAGRTAEAKARADAFAAAYPSSTHLRRVREIVGAQ